MRTPEESSSFHGSNFDGVDSPERNEEGHQWNSSPEDLRRETSQETSQSESSERQWLGFPRRLSLDDARQVIDDIRRIWLVQTGKQVGDLSTDLSMLKTWFDPLARGERLRDAIGELRSVRIRTGLLGDPFVLSAGESRWLVSPEGRMLLHLLRREAGGPRSSIELTSLSISEAEKELLYVYRGWAQQRLRDVLALQSGRAAPLLPQALGQVLVLLVNGSIGPERALRKLEDRDDRRAVDDALSSVVEAFANTLSPSTARRGRSKAHYSLYGGYSLSEARRRLGRHLVISQDAVFLASGSVEAVVDRIAAELARRDNLDEDGIKVAFDELVVAYQSVRPLLASYGMSFQTPSVTAQLRQDLLSAFRSRKGVQTQNSESPPGRGDTVTGSSDMPPGRDPGDLTGRG